MGKKAEKSISKERQLVNAAGHTEDNYLNKPSEPYKCIGNFLMDFTELCKQQQMSFIPSVICQPKVPPILPVIISESKIDKKSDKKQMIANSETEHELEGSEVTLEGPPKTYTARDKFYYFKPKVQVELDIIDKWDTVSEVFVKGWKIDGPMMEVFRQSWMHLTKLHTINLWNVGLTEETLHTLATFLPLCASVKTLILDGNSVTIENWSELIDEKSIIQNLSLRYCNITDNGAAELSKVLGTSRSANTKLLSLNLSGNKIGDNGAERLAESLRINRTLLSLTLSNNYIGNQGTIKIAEALSRFPLTHNEVVIRRKLLSEKGPIERKSLSSQELKGKDSKEDTKTPKKEKEDSKAGSRKAPANQNTVTGRTSSASGSEINKSQSKIKDKKKGLGKSSNELDLSPSVSSVFEWNAGSQDQMCPLLDPAEYIDGELWIAGNRTLINLNLSRNKIGEIGFAALLKAIQYQMTLTLDSKIGGSGLLRLVINKNDVPLHNEIATKINQIMLAKDPFYKPQISDVAAS